MRAVIIAGKGVDNMDYQEAYEKAKKRGMLYCYYTCVRDGAMPLEYALQKSGLIEAEFMREMTKMTVKEERLRTLEKLILNKTITEEDAVKMFDVTAAELRAWSEKNRWFGE